MTDKKPVQLPQYLPWLTSLVKSPEQLKAKLQVIRLATHSPDHAITKHPQFNGVCGDCGWPEEDTQAAIGSEVLGSLRELLQNAEVTQARQQVIPVFVVASAEDLASLLGDLLGHDIDCQEPPTSNTEE